MLKNRFQKDTLKHFKKIMELNEQFQVKRMKRMKRIKQFDVYVCVLLII